MCQCLKRHSGSEHFRCIKSLKILFKNILDLKKKAQITLTDPVDIVESQKDLSIEDVFILLYVYIFLN